MRAGCTASIMCRRRTPPSAISLSKTPAEAGDPNNERSKMKVALAGAGAFGVKHLEAIAKINGVQVVSVVRRTLDATKEVAARFGVGHVTTELDETLRLPGLDA